MSEFDETPPPGAKYYRVQLPDCSWSRWLPWEQPCPYDYILSIQLSPCADAHERDEFWRQFREQLYIGISAREFDLIEQEHSERHPGRSLTESGVDPTKALA